MTGNYLLDTNAIIYGIDRKLTLPAHHYAISVITKLELLSWPALSEADDTAIRHMLQLIRVIELTPPIQEAAITVRRSTSLKLPDSIISATAMVGGFVLVTDDEKLSNHHHGTTITLTGLTG